MTTPSGNPIISFGVLPVGRGRFVWFGEIIPCCVIVAISVREFPELALIGLAAIGRIDEVVILLNQRGVDIHKE